MKFDSLNREDVEKVREWRNKNLHALRTPFSLTKEQQEKFYDDIVCNRNARARYFGVKKGSDILIGMTGLENIEWENGLAEISIVIDPSERGKTYGEEAVYLLLKQGFENMRLNNIYGECYACNPAIEFWKKIIKKYGMFETYLPYRKFVDGKYYDSIYFSMSKSDWDDITK